MAGTTSRKNKKFAYVVDGEVRCGNCSKVIAKAYYGAYGVGIEIRCRYCKTDNYVSLDKDP